MENTPKMTLFYLGFLAFIGMFTGIATLNVFMINIFQVIFTVIFLRSYAVFSSIYWNFGAECLHDQHFSGNRGFVRFVFIKRI